MGYSRPDAVLNLYERKKDEFNPATTRTIEMMVGGQMDKVRIFSLRGCHLLAMFARTSVAKEFRVWVLDVLETLNETQPQPLPLPLLATKEERRPLDKLVKVWASLVGGDSGVYARLWTQVNAHLGVAKIENATRPQIKKAIDFVQTHISLLQAPESSLPQPQTYYTELCLASCEAMLGEVKKAWAHENSTMNVYLSENVLGGDFCDVITNQIQAANNALELASHSISGALALKKASDRFHYLHTSGMLQKM